MLDGLKPTRRGFLALAMAVAGVAAFAITPAIAHHGWEWAEDQEFEIAGRITEAKLGNPHGILKIDVKGDVWTVEVGQPWRNERAGLKDEMLAPGTLVTIHGHRSKDPALLVVKAERIVIAGKSYDLYPDRP